MIDNRFIDRMPQLSPVAVKVYLALARRGRKCFPGLTRIQGDTGLSRPSVTKATAELKAAKLLDIEREGRDSNNYTLLEIPSSKNRLLVNSVDAKGKKALPDQSKVFTEPVNGVDPNNSHQQDSQTRIINNIALKNVFLGVEGAEGLRVIYDSLAETIPPKKPADQRYLERLTILIDGKNLPECCWRDALETTKAKGDKLKNPGGYFNRCLWHNCREKDIDLKAQLKLLRKVPSAAGVVKHNDRRQVLLDQIDLLKRAERRHAAKGAALPSPPANTL
jgi:hypothetical protein